MSKRGRDFMQDPAVQAKLRDLEKVWVLQRRADLRAVMSLPAGRRFVYDLLFDKCGLMDVYPAQDSGIYRHEGKRDVGQKLAREIQTDLAGHYVEMVNEHLREQEARQKLREAALQPSAHERETES